MTVPSVIHPALDDGECYRFLRVSGRCSTRYRCRKPRAEAVLDEYGLFIPSKDVSLDDERLEQSQGTQELYRLASDEEDSTTSGSNAERAGAQHEIYPREIAQREVDAVVHMKENVEVVRPHAHRRAAWPQRRAGRNPARPQEQPEQAK